VYLPAAGRPGQLIGNDPLGEAHQEIDLGGRAPAQVVDRCNEDRHMGDLRRRTS
jgi:hypothetical protein